MKDIKLVNENKFVDTENIYMVAFFKNGLNQKAKQIINCKQQIKKPIRVIFRHTKQNHRRFKYLLMKCECKHDHKNLIADYLLKQSVTGKRKFKKFCEVVNNVENLPIPFKNQLLGKNTDLAVIKRFFMMLGVYKPTYSEIDKNGFLLKTDFTIKTLCYSDFSFDAYENKQFKKVFSQFIDAKEVEPFRMPVKYQKVIEARCPIAKFKELLLTDTTNLIQPIVQTKLRKIKGFDDKNPAFYYDYTFIKSAGRLNIFLSETGGRKVTGNMIVSNNFSINHKLVNDSFQTYLQLNSSHATGFISRIKHTLNSENQLSKMHKTKQFRVYKKFYDKHTTDETHDRILNAYFNDIGIKEIQNKFIKTTQQITDIVASRKKLLLKLYLMQCSPFFIEQLFAIEKRIIMDILQDISYCYSNSNANQILKDLSND